MNEKSCSDYLLCLVPDLWIPQELLWSCGEIEFESEAKHIIHSTQEVQAALDLLLNLRSKTKCNRIFFIHLDMAANFISGVIIIESLFVPVLLKKMKFCKVIKNNILFHDQQLSFMQILKLWEAFSHNLIV